MGNTIMRALVSLDSYTADTNGDVGPLFDWYANGDMDWKFTEKQEQPCRIKKAPRDFMQGVYPQKGAVVIARSLFDHTNWLYDVGRMAFEGEAARC